MFLSPCGEPFTDAVACELSREERLLFVCGHYEGIDERAYALADRVISLGDYVLTSGELASMAVSYTHLDVYKRQTCTRIRSTSSSPRRRSRA